MVLSSLQLLSGKREFELVRGARSCRKESWERVTESEKSRPQLLAIRFLDWNPE